MILETDIRRVGEETPGCGILFFGKRFDSTLADNHPVILCHCDYPMVTERLIRQFESAVRGRTHAVATGSTAPVHPYRLMKLDKDGHQRYLAEISQEIRGNRHRYPNIVSFRPALVYLPSGLSLGDCARSVRDQGVFPELYSMDQNMLLDRTIFLEALLIRVLSSEKLEG